jgi:hypothetical protein
MERPSDSSSVNVSFVTDTSVAVADRASTVEVLMPAIQQVLLMKNLYGPLQRTVGILLEYRCDARSAMRLEHGHGFVDTLLHDVRACAARYDQRRGRARAASPLRNEAREQSLLIPEESCIMGQALAARMLFVLGLGGALLGTRTAVEASTADTNRPNILLVIADDWSFGHTGKGWGPGDFKAGGFARNPAGPPYQSFKLEPPLPGVGSTDFARNQARSTRPAIAW